MHVFGSSAIAGLLLLAVRRYCHRQSLELPVILIAAIVISGTLSAGTLWEIFEFTIDRTGLFNAQRGLYDTMLDLIADASGGVMLVVFSLTTNFFHTQSRYCQHISPDQVITKSKLR